jgi:hypothetical protein
VSISGPDGTGERPTLTFSSSSILDSESLDSSELDCSVVGLMAGTEDGTGETSILTSSSSSELDVEPDSESLDPSELDSLRLDALETFFGATSDADPLPSSLSESESDPEVESAPDVIVRLDSESSSFLALSWSFSASDDSSSVILVRLVIKRHVKRT